MSRREVIIGEDLSVLFFLNVVQCSYKIQLPSILSFVKPSMKMKRECVKMLTRADVLQEGAHWQSESVRTRSALSELPGHPPNKRKLNTMQVP